MLSLKRWEGGRAGGALRAASRRALALGPAVRSRGGGRLGGAVPREALPAARTLARLGNGSLYSALRYRGTRGLVVLCY